MTTETPKKIYLRSEPDTRYIVQAFVCFLAFRISSSPIPIEHNVPLQEKETPVTGEMIAADAPIHRLFHTGCMAPYPIHRRSTNYEGPPRPVSSPPVCLLSPGLVGTYQRIFALDQMSTIITSPTGSCRMFFYGILSAGVCV